MAPSAAIGLWLAGRIPSGAVVHAQARARHTPRLWRSSTAHRTEGAWEICAEIAGRREHRSAALLRRGEELSPADVRAAELGFKQLLRRKRFSAAFLDRHANDLLAQARFEYVRHVASGDDVRSPVGWIIHCAWRRTQNLLEHESRTPHSVSIEEEDEAPEAPTPTPEEETLQADRHRKVREAVEALPPAERKLIALTYFEGMSVREASRALGWANRTGDRRHQSALTQLQELLGVKDAEALQIEVGAAAWGLLAADRAVGPHLPAAVQLTLESAGRGALELAGRAQELARRLLTGGGGDVSGSAGGRVVELGGGNVLTAATAGVCGVAAVTCLATAVLPGADETDPGNPGRARHATEQQVFVRPAGGAGGGLIEGNWLPSPALVAKEKGGTHHKEEPRPAKTGPRHSARPAVARPASPPVATPEEVATEFDPFPAESEPSNSESATEPQTPPSAAGGGQGPAPEATGKQVEAEFGF